MSTPEKPTPLGDLRRWWRGILIAVAAWALFSLLFGTPCLLVLLFGIPCPLCGMTRAMFAALQGQWAAAFALHPMWPTVPVLALAAAAVRYRFPRLRRWLFGLLALWLTALVAVYVWRMWTSFPSAPPLVYTPHNALAFLLSLVSRVA